MKKRMFRQKLVAITDQTLAAREGFGEENHIAQQLMGRTACNINTLKFHDVTGYENFSREEALVLLRAADIHLQDALDLCRTSAEVGALEYISLLIDRLAEEYRGIEWEEAKQ